MTYRRLSLKKRPAIVAVTKGDNSKANSWLTLKSSSDLKRPSKKSWLKMKNRSNMKNSIVKSRSEVNSQSIVKSQPMEKSRLEAKSQSTVKSGSLAIRRNLRQERLRDSTRIKSPMIISSSDMTRGIHRLDIPTTRSLPALSGAGPEGLPVQGRGWWRKHFNASTPPETDSYQYFPYEVQRGYYRPKVTRKFLPPRPVKRSSEQLHEFSTFSVPSDE